MRTRAILGGCLLVSACGGSGTIDATPTASMTGTGGTTGTTGTMGTSGMTGVTGTTLVSTSTGDEVGCGVESPEALMLCVERERYIADVVAVAEERTPGSAHWSTVQERCASSLEEAGFLVELQDYGSGVNVIGTLPGEGSYADELILLGAHYDHIDGCEGADDNASGVGGALEVARVLGQAQLGRTIVVACWDQEEVGYLGSKAHASSFLGESVVVVVNFDMIGFTDPTPGSQVFPLPLAERFPALAAELEENQYAADFLALTSGLSAEPFALELEARAEGLGRLTGVMALTTEEMLGEDYSVLARSDHRSFWVEGIPAVHVFDTGLFRNPAFHCFGGVDSVAGLDHDFATDVIRATVGAMAQAAGIGGS